MKSLSPKMRGSLEKKDTWRDTSKESKEIGSLKIRYKSSKES